MDLVCDVSGLGPDAEAIPSLVAAPATQARTRNGTARRPRQTTMQNNSERKAYTHAKEKELARPQARGEIAGWDLIYYVFVQAGHGSKHVGDEP